MGRKEQFDFKQFSITQRCSAMKVGTDGVLLGAWTPLDQPGNILDIGTGTGLIALMLAQRTSDSYIEAIEIDASATAEAMENFKRSKWPKRLMAIHKSLQVFTTESKKTYNLIVTNPPFFNAGTSSPYAERHQARHGGSSLSHEKLINNVIHLLSDDGSFCLIAPYKEGLEFIKIAIEKKLYPTKKLAFFSKDTKPQERWLIELKKHPDKIIENKLVQYNKRNQWSNDYKDLTKDFYLKL